MRGFFLPSRRGFAWSPANRGCSFGSGPDDLSWFLEESTLWMLCQQRFDVRHAVMRQACRLMSPLVSSPDVPVHIPSGYPNPLFATRRPGCVGRSNKSTDIQHGRRRRQGDHRSGALRDVGCGAPASQRLSAVRLHRTGSRRSPRSTDA